MTDDLRKYTRKRNFGKTGEPRGERPQGPSKQLRFVVHHHIAGRDHYDLRLEWGGVLKSWAVPKGPSYDPHDKRLAVQVEDHPLEYRDFEGTIPKGQYGGGVVMIWDEGIWDPPLDVDEGLADGSLKFTFHGSRLKGEWALIRMKAKPGEKDINWLLIKEKDEYENTLDIKQFITSVQSGRTMPEIEEGKNENTSHRENNADSDRKRTASGKKLSGHDDKKQKESVRSVENAKITHPEKVLYQKSGITKADIARYYFQISKRMMPYLENRLLSAVRCPEGIDGDCFFKKHPGNDNKGTVTVPVLGNSGTSEEYYYVEDAYGLMSEVQMNTLEFHVWGSRVKTLEHPDMMVFDLDPDEGMGLGKIRQGVHDLKNLLDQLSLISYLKTSGGKGYHIVVPFRPAAGWNAFEAFARNVAKTMEAKWPDRYTSNVRKNKRNNRIFVDWLRNVRGATSVAPYSVRAREGAPVSMPISWKELETITPNGASLEDALKRLSHEDPWAEFFVDNQQLK